MSRTKEFNQIEYINKYVVEEMDAQKILQLELIYQMENL